MYVQTSTLESIPRKYFKRRASEMGFPADYASKELGKLVRIYKAIHWPNKEVSCFIEALNIVVNSDPTLLRLIKQEDSNKGVLYFRANIFLRTEGDLPVTRFLSATLKRCGISLVKTNSGFKLQGRGFPEKPRTYILHRYLYPF